MKNLLLLLLCPVLAFAQTDSTKVNRKRLIDASAIVGAAYISSIIVLNEAWYGSDPRQSFHFFNDAPEWKQMDKVGHFYSSFHITDNASAILRSCNLSRKRSNVIAAITSTVMMSTIEVFDGFSRSYGASLSDVGANAAGTFFYIGQSWMWNDVRIHPKFSFHRTPLAKMRSGVLGSGASEVLKNYNGQTLWLAVDVAKFMPGSKWPKWLQLEGGYGAEDMFYARDNQNREIGYDPYRQYYLSVDIDFTAIPTRSKFLKALLKAANIIKVPMPALEFSRKGVKAHALYF